jgi:hypothetical protein
MGAERGVYRILVEKPKGKRALGRPRHRWEDNIRMDLQEVGCGGMDWINSLTQLVCKWQHVSVYYQTVIRSFIDLIDQVCTICWGEWDPISLQVYW